MVLDSIKSMIPSINIAQGLTMLNINEFAGSILTVMVGDVHRRTEQKDHFVRRHVLDKEMNCGDIGPKAALVSQWK